MKFPFEERLPYAVLALTVLAVFYGIYFAKMLAQRRRGIQTRQIGRRKERPIRVVETLMSVATLGGAVFLCAVLCMKDSWRAGIPDKDRTALVTTGIYRYSRNPAFLGFDLMYTGVLLMYCNPLTAAFSLFAVIMLHLQILQEEKYLTATFGAPYQAYCRRVFRYLGRR